MDDSGDDKGPLSLTRLCPWASPGCAPGHLGLRCGSGTAVVPQSLVLCCPDQRSPALFLHLPGEQVRNHSPGGSCRWRRAPPSLEPSSGPMRLSAHQQLRAELEAPRGAAPAAVQLGTCGCRNTHQGGGLPQPTRANLSLASLCPALLCQPVSPLRLPSGPPPPSPMRCPVQAPTCLFQAQEGLWALPDRQE